MTPATTTRGEQAKRAIERDRERGERQRHIRMLFTDSSSILRGCHIVREPPNAAAVAPVDEAATLAATPTSQLALQLFFLARFSNYVHWLAKCLVYAAINLQAEDTVPPTPSHLLLPLPQVDVEVEVVVGVSPQRVEGLLSGRLVWLSCLVAWHWKWKNKFRTRLWQAASKVRHVAGSRLRRVAGSDHFYI